MTVTTTVSKVTHSANGVTIAWPFAFSIPTSADVEVIVTSALGAESIISLASYAITGLGNPTGGTVTYPISGPPLAAGNKLTVRRKLGITQSTDLVTGAAFYAEDHEEVFDRHTMIDQQQQEQLDRALKIPVSDGALTVTLPVAVSRAGKAIKFDANGNVTVSTYDPDAQVADATAQASAATASATAAAISATTAETRAAEADAAAAQAQTAVAGVLPKVNVKSYGAKGDGRRVTDASTATGSDIVTSATAGFAAADVGKKIQVYATVVRFDAAGRNATWAGAVIRGTITAVLSATQIQVSNSATASMAGATCRWGTDDYDAVVAAVAALKSGGGGVLYFPAGEYWLRTRLTVDFGNISIRGDGPGASRIKQDYTAAAPNTYPWGGWDALKIVSVPGGSSYGEMTAWDILKGAFGKQHYLRNVSVKDLAIDGDRFYFDAAHQNTTGNGIGGHGINVKHCIGVDISGVLVVDAVRVGIFVQGVESVSITGNKIFDCAEQALQAVGMRSFVISGNEMRGTLYTGIQAQLTGIDLEPDSAHAEYPHIKDGVVTGNTITDCRYAITVLSMSNVTTASATGTWAAGTAYSAGAVVQKNGVLYLGCAASTGQDPELDAIKAYWVSFEENLNEDIVISGNRIAQPHSGDEGQAIWVGKYSNKYYRGISVTGNVISYNNQYDGGVVFYGVCNSVISGNTIRALANAADPAITLRGCKHIIVSNNSITSLSNAVLAAIMSGGGGKEGDTVSSRISITGNNIDMPVTTSLSLAAIYFGGAGVGTGHTDCTISNNICKGMISIGGNDWPTTSKQFTVIGNRVITGNPATHNALSIARGVPNNYIADNLFSGQVLCGKDGSNPSASGTYFANNRWLDGATGYDFGTLTQNEIRNHMRFTEIVDTNPFVAAPATSTATGRPGEQRMVGGVLYQCYGKDQWSKVTLTTTF